MLCGCLLFVLIYMLPLQGLAYEGKICLALTLMTVALWAFQVAQSGFVACLFLGLLVVLRVAEPPVVFKAWTTPTIYLVIGGYLIAGAMKASGLGERIAYGFILRFVRGYRSIILSIFALMMLLCLLIPQPWPRSLLLMSVVSVIIRSAVTEKADAIHIGFAVFVASVPSSLIFLTADSSTNPLVLQSAGVQVGWLQWLFLMGIPGLAATALTCALFLWLFPAVGRVSLDKGEIQARRKAMGPMRAREIRVLLWLGLAIALWATDALHGIAVGWVTLLIAAAMSLPGIGGVLTPKSWAEVPVEVLLFMTAAIAIGNVGAATGMNEWLTGLLFSLGIPQSTLPFLLAAVAIAMGLHMLMGSVIAVLGIAVPVLLSLSSGISLPALGVAWVVQIAVSTHYLLPFQHLNIMVGLGEGKGGYSAKEVLRMGLPLTLVVFVVVFAVALPWWKLVGLW